MVRRNGQPRRREAQAAATFRCSRCALIKPLVGSSYGVKRGISWRCCAGCSSQVATAKEAV